MARERPLLPQVAAFALDEVMVGSSTALDGEMRAVEVVGAALRGVYMALALLYPSIPVAVGYSSAQRGQAMHAGLLRFCGAAGYTLGPIASCVGQVGHVCCCLLALPFYFALTSMSYLPCMAMLWAAVAGWVAYCLPACLPVCLPACLLPAAIKTCTA